MASSPPALSFPAEAHVSLRAAGLVGDPVVVTYANRALHLAGASSGTLDIAAGQTERVRFGYYQGKYSKLYVARIWLMGGAGPVIIEPGTRESPAYGAAMRQFAGAVAATRGIGAVERGLSGVVAVLMLVVPLLMVLGFNITAWVLMTDQNLALWYALLVFSWLLAAIYVWLFAKRQRPVALVSLDELESQLPPLPRAEPE